MDALQYDVSLKPYNTLAIDVKAKYFVSAQSLIQIQQALAFAQAQGIPFFLLGGGSNLVLTQDIPYLVLHIATKGIQVLSEDQQHVTLEVQAGENWHAFVQWSLAQGWSGLENLSLIPGTVGAAPVQNIGAYGVEVKDYLDSLTALDTQTGEVLDFSNAKCQFSYRESYFKQHLGRYLILSVRFRLNKQAKLHLEYGPIRQQLAEEGIAEPTPQQVAAVVCTIRQSKLPNPAELANTGSFFKNPLVSTAQVQRLKQAYPDLISYNLSNEQAKLAAGWLIEKAGWKGYRQGDAGVHAKQALVLVNYGNASGKDILQLAQKIQQTIRDKFQVSLEIEPNRL
ncbi:UDP-N-acetylmuramate dehydrogenase [Pseudomonas sp. F1_0610]|uniref:UDP-N-acetylmuramate dehydrogenase n=1 Tax=Pseudomonas sp. F1_0610 TaxID=3114284 RepID=UPI0039C13F17